MVSEREWGPVNRLTVCGQQLILIAGTDVSGVRVGIMGACEFLTPLAACGNKCGKRWE